MDEIILEEEKFNTLKEIAELQTNISEGRAALKKIHDDTDEYLEVREGMVNKRITKVLKESREALEATTTNHKELSAYNRDLKAYANDLTGLANGITVLFQDFNKALEEAEKDMSEGSQGLTDLLTKIKIERVQVAEDRKMLQIERDRISDEWKLLRDRQETLKKGFIELKAKQKLI